MILYYYINSRVANNIEYNNSSITQKLGFTFGQFNKKCDKM